MSERRAGKFYMLARTWIGHYKKDACGNHPEVCIWNFENWKSNWGRFNLTKKLSKVRDRTLMLLTRPKILIGKPAYAFADNTCLGVKWSFYH